MNRKKKRRNGKGKTKSSSARSISVDKQMKSSGLEDFVSLVSTHGLPRKIKILAAANACMKKGSQKQAIVPDREDGLVAPVEDQSFSNNPTDWLEIISDKIMELARLMGKMEPDWLFVAMHLGNLSVMMRDNPETVSRVRQFNQNLSRRLIVGKGKRAGRDAIVKMLQRQLTSLEELN